MGKLPLKERVVRAMENDLRYLMPWHRLASFLGVIPFADWRRSREFGLRPKIKLCVMISLALLAYPWSIYTKSVEKFYADKRPAIAVMDISSAGLFTFSAVVCFVELGCLKRKHFRTFLAKLDQADAHLKKTSFRTETRLRFYFKAVLLHVFVFTASGLVVFHMSSKYKKYVAISQLTKEVEIYYASVLMVLTYNYSVCIGIRFRKANWELEGISFRCALGVRRLAKIYFVLLDVLRLFNLVFGWQMLALAARLVVDTVFLISTGVFLVSVRTVQSAIVPMAVFVLKALLSWVLVVLLAASCNKLTREVRKTVAISYELMRGLRSIESTPQTRLVHDQLFLLTQEIASVSAHVSAAGFFPVDYRMLFTCLSCVTSYLIVLIQFNK